MIKTKSIYYNDKEPHDGARILVMRRWPRGISKDQIDEWRKDLGPSMELCERGLIQQRGRGRSTHYVLVT